MAASTPCRPSTKHTQDNPHQHAIQKLWRMSITDHPGKLHKILLDSSLTRKKNLSAYQDANTQKNATVSYAEAAAACKGKVNRISQDCRQANQKFVDKAFDIENDLMLWRYSQRVEDCLIPLGHSRQRDFDEMALRPFSVKRVDVSSDLIFRSCSLVPSLGKWLVD